VAVDVTHSFDTFGFPFKCRKHKKELNMIWKTVAWSLWIARNARIFDGKETPVGEIVEGIKAHILTLVYC
jgi:hypothetical protein